MLYRNTWASLLFSPVISLPQLLFWQELFLLSGAFLPYRPPHPSHQLLDIFIVLALLCSHRGLPWPPPSLQPIVLHRLSNWYYITCLLANLFLISISCTRIKVLEWEYEKLDSLTLLSHKVDQKVFEEKRNKRRKGARKAWGKFLGSQCKWV